MRRQTYLLPAGCRRVEPVRHFTPEEAQAVVPRLRPLLAALRESQHGFAFAQDQVADLRRAHGDSILHDKGHPESAELARWEQEHVRHRRQLGALMAEIHALGADVKDPILGLVDFYARRGDETVLLCYRDDEETITHWHTMAEGFGGRRPLSEF